MTAECFSPVIEAPFDILPIASPAAIASITPQ